MRIAGRLQRLEAVACHQPDERDGKSVMAAIRAALASDDGAELLCDFSDRLARPGASRADFEEVYAFLERFAPKEVSQLPP